MEKLNNRCPTYGQGDPILTESECRAAAKQKGKEFIFDQTQSGCHENIEFDVITWGNLRCTNPEEIGGRRRLQGQCLFQEGERENPLCMCGKTMCEGFASRKKISATIPDV